MLFTKHLDGGTHAARFDGAGQPLRGTDAKGALTLHAYDPLGRPTQAWARDAAGETVRRRQHLVYGTDASLNNNGQLVEHYDEAGRLRLTAFDFKGNVLEKSWQVVADEVFTSQWSLAAGQNWQALPAGFNAHWDDLSSAAVTARLAPRPYVTSTGYDGLNRATQLTLPAEPGNGEARPVLVPRYNRAGALAQVSLDGEVLLRQLAYNARGQRLLLARGNGLVTRYSYDPVLFRLQRLRTEGYDAQGLTLTPRSGTTRQDTGYTYDLAGNITATRERAPQSGVAGTDELTRGFTYDALYRLLSATGRENQPTAARPWQQSTRADGVASTTAYTQRYAYDVLGNIQQLRHVASNSTGSFTRTFDYGSGATNYLQAVQLGADTVAYQYDAAGNVSQENGSRHYQWDAASQLRQFATWTGAGSAPTLLAYYLYAGGQRVKKLTQTSADTWQVTVYAESGFEHRYEVSNSILSGEQTQVAVLDDQHRLYQRRMGAALGDQRPDKLYALDDHLGSAVVQTGTTGQLVGQEEYYPFGETSFGSTGKQRYRFCGKELDEESGLYYYGMRYYAAWLCRFVSVDPLAAKYTHYTPYQYAGNKPINYIDLDGAEEAKPGASTAEPKTNLPGVTVTAVGLLGKSAPAFQEFIHNIDYAGFVNKLYQSKIETEQQNGLNMSWYGKDENNLARVPEATKARRFEEAANEAMPALKALWAMQQSGVNPNSLNHMLNPLAKIAFTNALNQTITSKEEGWSAFNSAALSIAFDWVALRAGGGTVSPGSRMLTATAGEAERSIAGETYFRAMSHENFAFLNKFGVMPATGETSISPTASYSKNYNGVLVEFNLRPGTTAQLEEIGIRNVASDHPMPHLPVKDNLPGGWTQDYARFKWEKTQMNIGLGKGKAAEIFSNNVRSYKVINH